MPKCKCKQISYGEEAPADFAKKLEKSEERVGSFRKKLRCFSACLLAYGLFSLGMTFTMLVSAPHIPKWVHKKVIRNEEREKYEPMNYEEISLVEDAPPSESEVEQGSSEEGDEPGRRLHYGYGGDWWARKHLSLEEQLDRKIDQAEHDLRKCFITYMLLWVTVLCLARLGYRLSYREKMGHGRPFKRKVIIIFTVMMLVLGVNTHVKIKCMDRFHEAVRLAERLHHQSADEKPKNDRRKLQSADEVWGFVQQHLSRAVDQAAQSVDKLGKDLDRTVDVLGEVGKDIGATINDVGKGVADVGQDLHEAISKIIPPEDKFSQDDVKEMLEGENGAEKMSPWSDEDKERMRQLTKSMTKWINTYATVLDDPEESIPMIVPEEPKKKEAVVEPVEPIEPEPAVIVLPKIQPVEVQVFEQEIVPPSFQTEGFVVFENSPDITRFSFKSNLANFDQISVTINSNPGKMNSMPTMRSIIPPEFAKMQEESFKMFDEVMERLHEREDWDSLPMGDWQHILPQSVKLPLPPMIKMPSEPSESETSWESDEENVPLLMSSEDKFLNLLNEVTHEEQSQDGHGRRLKQINVDEDVQEYIKSRHDNRSHWRHHNGWCRHHKRKGFWCGILSALIFILWMVVYIAFMRRFINALRKLNHLKSVEKGTEQMNDEESCSVKNQVAQSKNPKQKQAIRKQVQNQQMYIPPSIIPNLEYQVSETSSEPLLAPPGPAQPVMQPNQLQQEQTLRQGISIQVPQPQLIQPEAPPRQQATYTLEQVQALLELERQRLAIINQK